MAVYNDEKLRAMEDEMNRFEEEIGLPILPPPPPPHLPAVIGANTYHTVQRRLEEQQHVPGMPVPMGGYPPVVGIPPPPPPPPVLIPQQVRARPPIRHPMRPMGIGQPSYQSAPYGMMSLPPAPSMQPVPSVVSATPMMYAPQVSEPQIPMNMMDQGVYNSSDVSSIPPAALAQESIPSVPIVDPSVERRIKPKPREIPILPPPPMPLMDDIGPSKKKKNKKIVRQAGGQSWEDASLLEWEEDDFRLFCGDLGNDVTDEILIRTFSKYPSFLKAKVVRDKRTNKTKGFGFVSFKDPQDFTRAMKEMNGRYVGSRPIKLRKSSWRNRSAEVVRKKEKEKAALIGLLTGK
ncbi:RNA-binding protein 42 [Frankliniella occidentalis]|uniref:RNA-binding protein 42 n=1 Tax=Frankliniella occidentalis TaxID=133901 RepID=A0A6J1SIM4_FRAOC|nr:RNA-binding protein 42 [Frankliniella occidentalis]